jgi:hypothetical protein
MDPAIRELLKKPTISVENAGRVLDMSRNSAYDAVHRGDIQSVRMGKRFIVPTAPLRRLLGIEDSAVAA